MEGQNFEFRPATAEEMDAFRAVGSYVFAENPDPATAEPGPLQPEWTLAAFEGERLVATSGAYPFKMRLNGSSVLADGVTAVGTYPGYRRRGLVREMIKGLLQRSRENDVPISILWASMGAIYQRFGYGLASINAAYDVPRDYVNFQFGDPAVGHTQLLSGEQALEHCKAVYRDYSRDGSLLLHRAPILWELLFRRNDNLDTHIAVHFGANDEPDAYAVYRAKWSERDGPGPNQLLTVLEFCWRDINGYRGIWEYLAKHDLVERIRWHGVAEDDPAPNIFLEPRMLNRRTFDGIWLRVVDAEASLAGRGYDVAGAVTLRLTEDDLCPWNTGTYRVAAEGDEVAVTRLDGNADADLTVSVNGLASLLSGQASASQLDLIGRGSARDRDDLGRLDSFFATRRRPLCMNGF